MALRSISRQAMNWRTASRNKQSGRDPRRRVPMTASAVVFIPTRHPLPNKKTAEKMMSPYPSTGLVCRSDRIRGLFFCILPNACRIAPLFCFKVLTSGRIPLCTVTSRCNRAAASGTYISPVSDDGVRISFCGLLPRKAWIPQAKWARALLPR